MRSSATPSRLRRACLKTRETVVAADVRRLQCPGFREPLRAEVGASSRRLPLFKQAISVLASLFALCCIAAAGQPIAAALPATGIIDDCRYPDDAAAQAAWQPLRGGLGVSVATIADRKVLRLPCNFENTITERASWDRQVKLDLSSARGVQFQLLCRDTSPISYFSLYFQSGDGWYHGTCFPESATGWNTIVVDKKDMTSEGQPAGWAHIKTIRISAWRAGDSNTEFFLSDLRPVGLLGADAKVAILRGAATQPANPAEARDVEQYAEAIAQHLQALDVSYAVLDERHVTAENLQSAQVVILPFNPKMPDRTADELIQYAARGGKMLAFYTLPPKLLAALNLGEGSHIPANPAGKFAAIRLSDNALPGAPTVVTQRSWNINAVQALPGKSRALANWFDENGRPAGYPAILASTNSLFMTHVLLPDDAVNKRRLLLAMLGSLSPTVWQQASETAIARIGRIGGASSYEEALSQLTPKTQNNERAGKALAAAGNLRAVASDLIAQQKFPEAIDKAAEANQQLKEAFCLAQKPLPGEFRAFWCHSAFGVQGMEWDEAIERLATNGFTAILPNMLWGGVAFYPGKVLPVASPIPQRGDQIARCLLACRKYGIQVHVWKVNWNLGGAAPREFVDKLRAEHRLQAGIDGKEEHWLCPSHPENRKLEINSMVEVARNYSVDGLHFDYIRYPDADHCFCAGCKDRFRRAAGLPNLNWPKDVLPEGRHRDRWLEWRRANITAVVKAVSEQARAVRPGIKISAAVFPNWVNERDNIGQDWRLWCEKGYLDFVCPMDYTPSDNNFSNLIKKQLDWAGKTPCYPGIGASAASSRFGVDKIIDQINVTRRNNTRGFVIFNYGEVESREILPLLGLGITARK